MDKKKSQQIHAKKRVTQRYGITLNRTDIYAIVYMIINGSPQAKFLKKQTNRITIWEVVYKEQTLNVAYDKSRQSIASFLPKKIAENKV